VLAVTPAARRTTRVALLLAGVLVVLAAALVLDDSPAGRAGGTVPTTTIAWPSTLAVRGEPPVSTGRDPGAFTTTTAPGAVQVRVTGVRCVGYAGDGWWVDWQVSNRGTAREGTLLGRVDDSPPMLLARLGVAAGQTETGRSLLRGAGDGIVLAWATGGPVAPSFPVEAPTCPTDPADLPPTTT
jgi:hypothetical protein